MSVDVCPRDSLPYIVASNFCIRSRGVGVWVSVRVSARVSAPGVPLGCSDCQFQRSGCGRSVFAAGSILSQPLVAAHGMAASEMERYSGSVHRLQPPTARDTCGQRRRAVEVISSRPRNIMANRHGRMDGKILFSGRRVRNQLEAPGDPRLRCGGNRSCTFLLQSRPPRRVGGRLAQVA